MVSRSKICRGMLGTFAVASLLGLLSTLTARPVKADPYRWCAYYSGRGGGGTNCGFVTFQQCQATISGIGGVCSPNPHYTGSAYAGPPRRVYRPYPY